jgi:hypothetical protein
MPFDEVQRRAVEEIVEAVRSRKHWRAGVLLEQFVVSANLTALGALRTALGGTRPDPGVVKDADRLLPGSPATRGPGVEVVNGPPRMRAGTGSGRKMR